MSKSPLNILQQSPLDSPLTGHSDDVASFAKESGISRWVPSRYNVRATTDDGRLVLWNTFKGSMSVFRPQQKELVEGLLSKKGFEARPEGIVEYLRERGYLLREGSNEYRRLQTAIHQQHFRTDRLELILMASEDCNFRCKYCYEDFERGTMIPEVRAGVKKLVESRLKQLSYLQISWFGGEPLYGWRAIEDLAPFFMKTSEEHGLKLHNHMTTNGYLLTADIAERLFSWKIRNFQITIDGTAEDHDQNRPTRDGGKSHAVILNNLVTMSKTSEDFWVTIRVNYDNENYSRLGPFMDQVEKEFRDDPRFGMSFHAVGRWGGDNDKNLDVCGTSARDIGAALRAEAHRRGIKVGTLRNAYVGTQVCYAARPYNFLIGATGKIMKCTIDLDKKDRNVVGILNEEGVLDLDDDKMALWTEPAFENDKKCQKCVVLPLCQGTHCPQVRFDTGNSPCCSTRGNPKGELLETVEYNHSTPRKTVIGKRTIMPASEKTTEERRELGT